ncbi:hypothetical protein AB204_11580 [Xenorhabdus khoisanae]|uniref:Lipoprotein n=1 Tax=Xenorhabdus khoisanae TaxID=880157 RepID=A0A0J5FSS6_9GAMM|nr:hypothetical protein [Xenorhabdus khoisanae]KMJ44977.1 hypothetical protein AB204_11580 [Xenorhabdus khoisanae]
MKNKVFLVVLCSILLVGCSTTRLDTSASKEVPVERMFWESGRDNTVGKSTIIVKRDQGFIGAGCFQNVHFNGIKIAELNAGEKVTFYTHSGDFTLSTYLGGNPMCASLLSSLNAKILPNSINVFRIFVKNGSTPNIVRDNVK